MPDIQKTKVSENMTTQTIESVAPDAFVASIGKRVRELRQQKAISRRALSEKSGVSQRYLAQLEAGNGNVSVALLFKIAGALNRKPGWFMDGPEKSGDQDELAEMLKLASPTVLERVRQLLSEDSNDNQKSQRFCMLGLRGAGKSTLGKYAARKLGYEFVELNDVVERQAGIPIGEIMALYGQEGYRRLEREALDTVIESRPKVILAVGGGIVSEPETYNHLLSSFHTIWIKASPQEHMERVRKQGDQRPMAGNPRAMEELKSILVSRENLYAKADLMFDTSGSTLLESKAGMIRLMRELQTSTFVEN